MTASIPRGSSSVMAQRVEAPDSLDFFPTPPWATRALCEHVIGPARHLSRLHAWDPAAGQDHMGAVLAEYFGIVHRSDVHDYGLGHGIGSFPGEYVGPGGDVIQVPVNGVDWVITNPPFRLAVDFAERALPIAQEGVALLVRSVWGEGADRYRRLFSRHHPAIIAQFVERVPMVKGRWDPKASTATGYAWFVWTRRAPSVRTEYRWIPPCRKEMTRRDDAVRFAGAREAAE